MLASANAGHPNIDEAMKPPLDQPRPLHPKAAWASRHPTERRYLGRSVVLSVAIHLFLIAGVGLIALWFGIATLKDLMSKANSAAASGPAPEQSMTVNLMTVEVHAPPTPTPKPLPTPTPKPVPVPVPIVQALPVLPPVQPKQVAPAPAPPPSPTVVPSPPKPATMATAKPKPKYTIAHATGEGNSTVVSSAHVGTPDLPAPNYPPDALAMREGGTVGMMVVFRQDGTVESAQIQQSSGFSILDFSTRAFIYAHWKSVSLANTTIHVPVRYDPPGK